MDRERDESGQYTEQVTLEKVLNVFEKADLPVLTASEVAEEIDCSRASAYNKLEALSERADIRKKSIGKLAVVWWRPNPPEG